jgi:DNA-binding HxlR family transcriptional regulator
LQLIRSQKSDDCGLKDLVLQVATGSISTKVLTERLRMMESMGIVDRHYEPTIPPQVTYILTERGKELTKALTPLYKLALRWNAE